jgi:hypothetical protein
VCNLEHSTRTICYGLHTKRSLNISGWRKGDSTEAMCYHTVFIIYFNFPVPKYVVLSHWEWPYKGWIYQTGNRYYVMW